MLKNFWWPLEFGSKVSNKPLRVTALGQEFVLFRTSDNVAHVMSDLCVHRGGALSDGWIDGKDCIVCPYHGWEYKPQGECVKIPANLQHVPVPKKARVDSYPTREAYGYVWAFLGDLPEKDRPPFPELPHFDNPKFRHVTGDYHWHAYYERTLENSMDIAHAPWVHGGSFGNREEPEVESYESLLTPYGAEATVTLKPPKRNVPGLWNLLYNKETEAKGVKTRTGFYMPCITLLEVSLPMGPMILINAHIPVDEYHTVVKWTNMRGFFTGGWADGDARKRVIKIFEQDKPVVEAQRPELLPYDLGAELHVKADNIQISYRQTRQKYIDLGWGIDMHKIRAEYSRQQAVVIPSPARKEVPELASAWVMKEVPTSQVKK